eukprot:209425-Chlamydomonas_euryale.AAC.1
MLHQRPPPPSPGARPSPASASGIEGGGTLLWWVALRKYANEGLVVSRGRRLVQGMGEGEKQE